jgi:ABC-type multidrug transport system fused ATPase/permease subunit
VLIAAVRHFAFAQREGFRAQRTWLARINAYLNENLTGMTVVQLFNRQQRNLVSSTANRATGANMLVTFTSPFEPVVSSTP